jgi:hypothetical protein
MLILAHNTSLRTNQPRVTYTIPDPAHLLLLEAMSDTWVFVSGHSR